MAAAEWPTGPCPCFESTLVVSQRRDSHRRWVREETRAAWCNHKHSPCTRLEALKAAGSLLRCDGFLERCEVPKHLFDDGGAP